MDKIISWFEIPALDLNRASAFYENILAVTLNRGDMLKGHGFSRAAKRLKASGL